MGFLTDLGRTNTLRAVTNDISSLAVNMRQQNRADAESMMRREALQMQMDEQKRQNELMVVDDIFANTSEPVKKFILEKAQTAGILNNQNGILTVRRGDAINFYQSVLARPENARAINKLQVEDLTKQINALTQESINQTNPKKFQEMQQALAQLKKQRTFVINTGDLMEKTQALQGKFTQESIQNYINSGMSDQNLLDPIIEENTKTSEIKNYEYGLEHPGFAESTQSNSELQVGYRTFLSANKLKNTPENYQKWLASERKQKGGRGPDYTKKQYIAAQKLGIEKERVTRGELTEDEAAKLLKEMGPTDFLMYLMELSGGMNKNVDLELDAEGNPVE